MYGLLRPSTLAAIVVDLQRAADNSWIANDEESQALEDAREQLATLVGEGNALELIETSKSPRPFENWVECPHCGARNDEAAWSDDERIEIECAKCGRWLVVTLVQYLVAEEANND